MVQIRVPEEYGYFYDLAKCIIRGESLPIDEINLVGGRKSAKTTSIQLFQALIAQAQVKNVGMIALRNQVQDGEELLGDYENTYEAYDLPISVNKSKGLLKVFNQEIRIMGVNSQQKGNKAKKSGLAKFGNVKYIIVFFEERFEFNEDDVKAMKEAIRSIDPENKDVQYLYINACNPWAKSSEYISYCSKYQTWNTNILKSTGSQISQVDIDIGEGRIKRALFHYTNWRVAKEYLSESDIKNILDTWNIDSKRAATVDYGLPGYEIGAIYTDLLNNLGRAIYQEHTHLLGGIDIGWGAESRSGKTVAHFIGWTPGVGMDCYGEYVHDNSIHPKSMEQVASEIVKFYHAQMSEYCSRNGWAAPFPLRVRVDNMSIGVIALLNAQARNYGITWLQFTKCAKFQVNDRIEITRSAMYRHQIRLGDSVKLLKAEFELAHYQDTVTQKRAKENDHSINAFEYAIEPVMWKIAKENNLTKLAAKGVNLYE